MVRHLSARLPLAMLLFALTLPEANGGRFQRYPDSPDGEAASAQPARASEGVDTEASRNRLAENLADEQQADANDVPPGLLGWPLHGGDEVRAEYIYTSDLFCQTRGGLRTRDGLRYLGLLDVAVTADLEQLELGPGGTIFLLGEFSHGEGLTERFIGDIQYLDNIDAGYDLHQMSEFWWEMSLIGDSLTARFGKQDANAMFGFLDLGGDFVNSSFGMPPNIPMPAWPNQAMGAVVMLSPVESVDLACGLFDGAADGGGWGFSGTGITFTIGEASWSWSLFGEFPGDVQVGGWYHSAGYEHLRTGRFHPGHYGFYAGGEQMLVREEITDPTNDQGLGIFAQYSWAPAEYSEISRYFGAGLVYKGLLRGRDEDIAGLGVAVVDISDFLEVDDSEVAIEAFYKWIVSPCIAIQPDLQYIQNPSGELPDALAVGLRCEWLL